MPLTIGNEISGGIFSRSLFELIVYFRSFQLSKLNVYLAFRELYLWVKLSSLVLIWYLNVGACMISFFATRLVRTFVMVWEMLVEEIRRD